jgi:hypothetical protein
LRVSSYVNGGGNDREVIAVAFTTDQVNTDFILPPGFVYDPEVFTLPNLKGFGRMPDLWVAMSLDPVLKQMAKHFIASNPTSLADLIGENRQGYNSIVNINGQVIYFPVWRYVATPFEDMLARWAGVPIYPGSSDGLQMQGVIETFLNREFPEGARLTPGNVEYLENPAFYSRIGTSRPISVSASLPGQHKLQ